ncbi:MAG: hypothetical protein RMK57_10775 [Bryobacterales bacterium]|nr:hypothetical protein [Bryobacteraceae bacterium]MDW8355001.1 hypothetical protein [Bryobacterales bacterium]
MKAIQIAILAALVVTGTLLYKVWRGQQIQQAQAPAPAAATEPTASPAVEPPAAAPVAPSAAAAPGKPAPASKRAPAAPNETAQSAAPAAPEQTSPQASLAPAPPPRSDSHAVSAPPAPAPAPPRTVTIPAGTLIPARLSETLASDKMQVGDSFFAVLDSPLVINGLVIAEKGARLEGRVVEIEQAGRVKGRAALGIQLVRLHTSDGQRVAIETETFRREAEATKGDDAAKVGLGAGLGAAIGAIAGGGKGAAIGAAAGGAAGTGAVLATRGKPAVIPVETRIEFRLNSPVTLTEKR